jgi:hypothetical protein
MILGQIILNVKYIILALKNFLNGAKYRADTSFRPE